MKRLLIWTALGIVLAASGGCHVCECWDYAWNSHRNERCGCGCGCGAQPCGQPCSPCVVTDSACGECGPTIIALSPCGCGGCGGGCGCGH